MSSSDTINLIHQMAKENYLWGAERIRGELFKLDNKVATATIEKYIQLARPPRSPSQTWSVLLSNHVKDVWACDFLPVIDIFFRQTYLFLIVELASRQIVHFNATVHPTDVWVAQQLREANSYWPNPTLFDLTAIRTCEVNGPDRSGNWICCSGLEKLTTDEVFD